MNGTITNKKLVSGRKSWGFYFRAGKDANGEWQQVAKKGFSSKKEAEEALRKAISRHEMNPTGRDPHLRRVFRRVDAKAL